MDQGLNEYVVAGGPELLEARRSIADFAKQASKVRLTHEASFWAATAQNPAKTVAEWQAGLSVADQLRTQGTQTGFARPISAVTYSAFSDEIAVADWGGNIQILDKSSLSIKSKVQAGSGVISGLAWMSQASPSVVAGCSDGKIRIMNSDNEPTVLSAHTARVASVCAHPNDRHLVSGSHDCSWQLWDLQVSQALLTQTGGHSRGIHCVKVHCDGALLCTASLDGTARIWDIRSGKTVLLLDSHARECYACVFSPDGRQVATAGADNMIHAWDLRKPVKPHQIPAHKSTVTSISWPTQQLLWSGSHDQTVKAWDTIEWKVQKKLAIGQRVTAFDASSTGLIIGRHDRCVDGYIL